MVEAAMGEAGLAAVMAAAVMAAAARAAADRWRGTEGGVTAAAATASETAARATATATAAAGSATAAAAATEKRRSDNSVRQSASECVSGASQSAPKEPFKTLVEKDGMSVLQ
jgi:hypothetical protein